MNQIVKKNASIKTLKHAESSRDQIIWEKLSQDTVESMLSVWYSFMVYRTRINYQSGIKMLCEAGMINPTISLQAFSLINHDAIVDKIKAIPHWKETSRQSRAALYISFTRYLSRRFPMVFKKATPSREGNMKTFYKVHEKVVTEAMSESEWALFFSALEEINPRDCLIAKVTLQGGKRIREVLHLSINQINWNKREITFTQSKTRGFKKETIITYPESIMKALRDYIGDRLGYVFISRKGNPVILNQVANTFAKAGKKAGISFKVTPRVLRASAVTYLKGQGFIDSDIQKITGHASSEMVNAYDKSDRANNPSKKVSMIQ